jgi:hypothetical protein
MSFVTKIKSQKLVTNTCFSSSVAAIGDLGLPTCFAKQHHIAIGTRFGQDYTSGPSHIKMAMLGFIIGWHKSWTFKP